MRRACLLVTAAAVVATVGSAGAAGAAPAAPSHHLAARIAMTGHPNVSNPARFTLSESLPSGDKAASFRVTFGDASSAVHGTTPPRTLTHRYRRPGRYSVVLTVSDRQHTSLREHTTVLIAAAPAAKGAATAGTTPAPAPATGTLPAATPTSTPTSTLTSDALTTRLAAQGVTAVPRQISEPNLLALRITLSTPTEPPAWPGDPAGAAPTTTTTSGWVVWPEWVKPTGLVLYAHGCCGTPADLADEAAAIATPTNAVVVAMDYRDAATYAPDLAAEDSATAVADLQAALPSIGETVAYGASEGGAVTGLMIEHHPGLVDDWVDNAGPVDLAASAALWQKEIDDQSSEGPEIDTATAADLLQLYGAAVGTPPDPVRESDLSPVDHTALLTRTRLRQAFLIHSTGDAVVDYKNTDELSADLVQAGIPTYLLQLVPAGQPELASAYHMTDDAQRDSVNAIELALTGSPPLSAGLTTSQEPITVP